jgi:hypothetical protein
MGWLADTRRRPLGLALLEALACEGAMFLGDFAAIRSVERDAPAPRVTLRILSQRVLSATTPLGRTPIRRPSMRRFRCLPPCPSDHEQP